jgi:hypothetical protein
MAVVGAARKGWWLALSLPSRRPKTQRCQENAIADGSVTKWFP